MTCAKKFPDEHPAYSRHKMDQAIWIQVQVVNIKKSH